jgi:DNA-binding GntR family transcriptional regulator
MAERETRSERVYMGIRTEILAGERRPGERLPTSELTKTFNSSVGVVRESLLRLVELGVVQVRPMQGFFVAELTAEDLRDLTEARLEIETLALRGAVRQGDPQWEAQLVAAHHLLSITPRHREGVVERYSPDWGRAHGAFHTALIEGCRNRRILSMARQLRDSSELYRRWSTPSEHESNRDICGEHKRLLEAALARDAELAVKRLSEHIKSSADILRKGV